MPRFLFVMLAAAVMCLPALSATANTTATPKGPLMDSGPQMSLVLPRVGRIKVYSFSIAAHQFTIVITKLTPAMARACVSGNHYKTATLIDGTKGTYALNYVLIGLRKSHAPVAGVPAETMTLKINAFDWRVGSSITHG